MEARLDGADSRLPFSTSSSFTCHFWDYYSSYDSFILHKVQVADAVHYAQLKAVSFDFAFGGDFCCAVSLVF